MQMSESINQIAESLHAFQAEIGSMEKTGVNPYFDSKFVTLTTTWTAIQPLLTKHQLAIAQFPEGTTLVTMLMHTSGEYIQSAAALSPEKPTPQGLGSAITYMRRYAISSILGLTPDEDDDGSAGSGYVTDNSFKNLSPKKKWS